MQTIGERLEEARKRKGVSLREAAEATKIRSEYLQKFENNQFDIGLPEIYVRGFLRSYAGYLKINAEKIVTDRNAAVIGEAVGKAARRAEPRESFGRLEAPPPPTSSESAHSGENPARSPLDPLRLPKNVGAMLKIGIVGATAVICFVVIVFLVRAVLSPSGSSPSSAVTPVEDTITFVALDNVRIKIVQQEDNLEIFQGPLARGETKTLPKRGPLYITADVGRNIAIDYRGQRLATGFEGYGRALIP